MQRLQLLLVAFSIDNGVYLFNDFKVDNVGNVYSNVDVFNSEDDFEDAGRLRYSF